MKFNIVFALLGATILITTGCDNPEQRARNLHHAVKQGRFPTLLRSTVGKRGSAYRISLFPETDSPCSAPDSLEIAAWVKHDQIGKLAFLEKSDMQKKHVAQALEQYQTIYRVEGDETRSKALAQFQRIIAEYEEANVVEVECRAGQVRFFLTGRAVLKNGPPWKNTPTINVEQLAGGWYYYELEEPREFGP